MKTSYIILIILVIIFGIVGTSIYLISRSPYEPTIGVNSSGKLDNSCIEIGCGPLDIYAGSINSNKYYECKCRWAKTVNPENLVCFATDAEALAENRVKSEC